MYIPVQRTSTNAQKPQGYSNMQVSKAEQSVAQARLMFAFDIMSTVARVAKAAKQKKDIADAKNAQIAAMQAETVNFLKKAQTSGKSPLTETMGNVGGVGITESDMRAFAENIGIDFDSIIGGE